MNIQSRIEAFIELGKKISLNKDKLKAGNHNPWFTEDNLDFALNELQFSLSKENLYRWIEQYPDLKEHPESKRIGVIMAGNIPLVGFHDFLSVLISGNIFMGKLSSKDDKLLARIIDLLTEIEPGFKNYMSISNEKLSGFDAVIATGSNNTSRYFEYYFGKYPHIIRKNRNSAGILSGKENDEDLRKLADDIFLYFGLGCRSVSKLFIPNNFKLDHIFRNSLKYKNVINHNKYSNNYDYNRAIYLLNQTEFKDNGMMLMKEDSNYSSPVSVIFYERYNDINTLKHRIKSDSEFLQCIVSKDAKFESSVSFGQSQCPKLWDYADKVDTINFLTSL